MNLGKLISKNELFVIIIVVVIILIGMYFSDLNQSEIQEEPSLSKKTRNIEIYTHPEYSFKKIICKSDNDCILLGWDYSEKSAKKTIFKFVNNSVEPIYDFSSDIYDIIDGAWSSDNTYALVLVAKKGFRWKIFKYDNSSFSEILDTEYDLDTIGWGPDGNAYIVGYAFDIDEEISGIQNRKYMVIYRYDGTNFSLETYDSVPPLPTSKILWEPDSRYALILTSPRGSIYKYDGDSLHELYDRYAYNIIYDIEWQPNKNYFILIGGSRREGCTGKFCILDPLILKYDGIKIEDLTSAIPKSMEPLVRISSLEDSTIILSFNSILEYDGNNFFEVETHPKINITDVMSLSSGMTAEKYFVVSSGLISPVKIDIIKFLD